MNSNSTILYLNKNLLVRILSYLEALEVNAFGSISSDARECSLHSLLWTHIDLSSPSNIDIKKVLGLISRTSASLPLQKLSLKGILHIITFLPLVLPRIYDDIMYSQDLI